MGRNAKARAVSWMEDAVQVLGLGEYSQSRKTVFHDRRLRAMHLFSTFVVMVLYFGVYQICYLHEYAAFESVRGSVQPWYQGVADNPIDTSHCNNPDFDFNLGGAEGLDSGMVITNASCVPFDITRHMKTQVDLVQVVTISHQPNPEAVDGMDYFFTDNPGNQVVNFIHAYTTTWDHGRSLPYTEIHDIDGNVQFTFEEGWSVTGLTIADYMALGGKSLNDLKDEIAGLAQTPRLRVTGANLLVTVEMSNLRPFEALGPLAEHRAVITMEVLPHAWGMIGWAHHHDEETGEAIDNQQVGVIISFRFSGVLGRFQMYKLTLLLVQSLVLLGSSRAIVSFVALRLLPAPERNAFRAATVRDLPDLRVSELHGERVKTMMDARSEHRRVARQARSPKRTMKTAGNVVVATWAMAQLDP